MAKNFEKSKSAQTIKNVAQKSNEKANLIAIKYYKDEDLLDHPLNKEDTSQTADIEKSIEEQGFNDPIAITDFGAPEGQYYIVRGHRRRMAGRKKGVKSFPCILRQFNDENEVYNFLLHGNNHRDSGKSDPLLLAERYLMHKDYLDKINFSGSYRNEIATRMGLKPAQADRYNQMNDVILPIWDMIRAGDVGMSSITDSGVYTHSDVEQQEILLVMQECQKAGNSLSRPTVKEIVVGYRAGKRSWNEINQQQSKSSEDIISFTDRQIAEESTMQSVGAEPITETESRDPNPSPLDRNNESIYDFSHREGLEDAKDPYADERPTEEDYATIEKIGAQDEKPKEEKKTTAETKQILTGEKIIKSLTLLDGLVNEHYRFPDNEQAELTIRTMGSLIKTMMAEMEAIGTDYKKVDIYRKILREIEDELNIYKKA